MKSVNGVTFAISDNKFGNGRLRKIKVERNGHRTESWQELTTLRV